jgi:hypothetical protein
MVLMRMAAHQHINFFDPFLPQSGNQLPGAVIAAGIDQEGLAVVLHKGTISLAGIQKSDS